MLRSGISVAAMLSVAVPVDAGPRRAAIYSNVHYVEDGGDVVGMEVRVHPSPKPWIDFVLCEGECAPQTRLPVSLRPNGFSFVYREAVVDQDRRPAPDIVMPFIATYEGPNLVVRLKGAPSEKLRPQHKPIALR
jgi:hypothetical protein